MAIYSKLKIKIDFWNVKTLTSNSLIIKAYHWIQIQNIFNNTLSIAENFCKLFIYEVYYQCFLWT